jgi:hypothetical protein
VARKLGIHRRMVREALGDAVPKERKMVQRARPKLEPAIAFIDTILENDRSGHRGIRQGGAINLGFLVHFQVLIPLILLQFRSSPVILSTMRGGPYAGHVEHPRFGHNVNSRRRLSLR